MTHVKFNRKPFEGNFNNFMDGIFSELPAFINSDFNKLQGKTFIPVNVKETVKSYQLEVVAPGFEKTDFKINLDQNLLTISADKNNEAKNDVSNTEQDKQIRREYSFRSFKRSFTLDEKIDATNISASYINGVLVVEIPKKEEVKIAATEIVVK